MRSRYDTIKSLDTEPVVITFGQKYWAKQWLEETQAPFPLLLDPDREAYQAYGLERSLLRSWGWENFWYYVKALLSGRQWRGIQGDSTQLGGDFIVDQNGVIRLSYPSQDPTDRPPMSQLLEVLEELQQ